MIERIEGFLFVGQLVPERDQQNRIKEFHPYNQYDNVKKLKLHKYGLGPFCRFKIPSEWQGRPGVYVIEIDGVIKYVGECEDLVKRYNLGYGTISPRNCFEGGQPTNCRINAHILKEYRLGKNINLYFHVTENRFELERKLISDFKPDWNRTIGKYLKKERHIMETKVRPNKSYLKYDTKKYRPLEDYLNNIKTDSVTLLFTDIERIIDAKLPKSAYSYQAWWSNGGHNHSGAWLNAGWKVEVVKFGEYVKFVKTSG